MTQAGPGPLGDVEHGHRPGGEHGPDEIRGLLPVAVRREPVVDRDHALVRHDGPGDPTADGDGVQPLVVAQPVHVRLAGRVPAQHVQDRPGFVNGVASHPGTRGVRPLPGHGDLRPQRALAAALDFRRTRLHQHREVAGQQFRAAAAQPQQPVTAGGDLLAVVEHVGHVPGGRGQAGREPQLHRHPGFHVGGAAAVQPGPVEPGRDVARDRHGVEVPGQHHPLRPPERGTGHDRVSVPVHGQVRPGPQRRLDGVRERSFLAADRRDIDKLRGQRRPGEAEVKVRIHPASLGGAPAARWAGIAFAAARSAVTITATDGRRTLPVLATA